LGSISGAVTVNPAGTLAPSGATGILTVNNTLALAGQTLIQLDRNAATNGSVRGVTTLTYGGSLVLSNLTGTLARGDSFKIFDATAYSGAFSSITSSPALAAGLNWWMDGNGTVLINGAPQANDFAFGLLNDRSTAIPVLGGKFAPTDPDGNPLVVTNVSAPAHGTASTDGSSITYSPSAGYTGPDSITYTVSDGRGGVASATISLSVSSSDSGSPNVVSAPRIVDGAFHVGFAGIPNFTYRVDRATNPSGPWEIGFTNLTAGTNGLFEVVDPDTSAPQRYYRTVFP
jgi:hypothetical protein